ncbi:hypothetical protein DFJ68_2693 [Terracoccus luteus]|uniref:Integral membrane protein n=1 Tax=Terracoccus luteus TaxID=53356 RepID=A0A495Y0U8_9MICO|nr:hypothetical protein [Terracoccus luteus]RKT79229.1 hypothetical protein DFJ68_2693 [Terracoccus luteus]
MSRASDDPYDRDDSRYDDRRATATRHPDGYGSTGRVERHPSFLRTLLSLVLGLVAVLLMPLGLVTAWTAYAVTQTDAFVDTAAPLVQRAEVQRSIASDASAAVVQQLDLSSERLRQQVQAPVRQAVQTVVASDEFAQVWRSSLRQAHAQLVDELRRPATGSAADGLTVDLQVRVPALRERLASFGVDLPSDIAPTVQVPVLSASQADALRGPFQLLDAYGLWVPVVALGLAVLAVAVANRRRLTAGLLALGFAVGAALLAAALALARPLLVGAVADLVSAESTVRAFVDAAYGAAQDGIHLEIGVLLALCLLTWLVVAVTRPRRRRA